MSDINRLEIEGDDEEFVVHEPTNRIIPIDRLDISDEEVEEVFEFISELGTDRTGNWSPPTPSSDAYVWRYLNFTQLLSIFERDAIWFTRVDNFEDPYEGTIPTANRESEIEDIRDEFDMNYESANNLHRVFRGSQTNFVTETYVNCWNVNEHQSAALWEQYIDSPQGVAIRTTVERLHSAVSPEDFDPIFGEVEYIDYEEDTIPVGALPIIYHKRESFEHEQEYRISCQTKPDTSDEDLGAGFYVNVDTETLIDKVVISPVAPDWFSELVQLVLDRYELDCDLKESGLYSQPK